MDNMQILKLLSNNYNIRTDTFEGRPHIVIPVVMMVDGVHAGSQGPLLHLSEDYGKFPESWNGMPIVVQHPEDAKGKPISANSPLVTESQKVGTVFNTELNGKLRAEAWIDREKISQVSPTALSYINSKKPLDVSVGVFTDEEANEGDWDGESYGAIARNHRPDHLALLPGGTGACSWDDGCGVRTNKANGGDKLKGITILSKGGHTQFQVLELGFEDIHSEIQSKLDGMDTDVKFHFLERTTDEDFVYSVRGSDGKKFFSRSYTVQEDQAIEFTGEPEEVIRNTTFDKVNANKEGVEPMKNKEAKPTKEVAAKVDLLIQCENCKFKESDRETLLTLKEDMLDKLIPEQKSNEPADPPQINKADAIQVLKDSLTPDELFALMPKEVKEAHQHGVQMLKEKKDKLIDHIITNAASGSTFTKDALEAKEIGELNQLASLVQRPVDYSSMGGGRFTPGADDEGLYPACVEPEEKTQH